MKRFSWISPFLFTLAFLLYTYYSVMHLVSPDQLVRLLVALWLLLGLLYYPAYIISRNWEWASVLLTIFVFGFYFSRYFFYLASSIVFVIIILCLIYSLLRGFKITATQISFFLNGIAIAIIALALYRNSRPFTQVPWLAYQRSVNQVKNYSIEIPSHPSNKPDIYYIVLDGYLRSDLLRELYGFDNTQFTDYLHDRGFVVPTNAHSNYAKTPLSISSTLNMDYVDSFSPGLENSYFWWLMAPFIDHSRVRAVLESQGYTTISLSTDWNMTDNHTTDIYLSPFPVMLTDFEGYILGGTPLKYIQPAIKNFASVPTFDTHRSIIIHSFQSLMKIPEISGPKFIFAHITAPHPPFVFNQNGDPIDPPGHFSFNDAEDFYGSTSEYQNGYRGQVKFVNTQMQVVIDSILKKSKTPPIIIIQADHGSGLLTDFSSAENTCVKERFSPFAAYYLPGLDYDTIPSDITPVNLFRIIFNEYFGTDLPMLENKQYYYKDTIYLYSQVDVTSRINEECTIR